MQVDYIIVGQGLAGTVLGHTLQKKGARIVVIADNAVGASKVAAGMFNPVTGKRMTKTWRANDLFPFMNSYYREVEKEFGVSILHSKLIYKPFSSIEEQNTWTSAVEDSAYVDTNIPKEKYQHYLNSLIGGYETKFSGYVDIPELLNAFYEKLTKEGLIRNEKLDAEALVFEKDFIEYKGIKASKIIYCDGVQAMQNVFFNWLPFYPSKGEVLVVEIENFQKEVIFNKQVFIIPLQSNKFRVGSTYVWEYSNDLPTDEGKQELSTKLGQMIKMPFSIVRHEAGIRPTVKDRKPIIGMHPIHKQIGIFNGLGTKGVSIAPYFAEAFAEFLLNGKQLEDEINIERFYSLYSHSKVEHD